MRIFFPRYSLKTVTFMLLIASFCSSVYYISYTHRIRRNIRKSRIAGVFGNSTDLFKCPILQSPNADIDTSKEFQRFNLEPIWLTSRSFWDTILEERYRAMQSKSKSPLKVILVPHSHNDPGWLETYTYYYRTETSKILNNMIDKLEEYKNMTFIWSETIFLKSWWETASISKRKSFQKLVKSGRLEITTGGWVMADEATTHLYALVDQLLEGHQWIYKYLGIKPKYGWAVDVFGHSSTQAQLLALSGIKGTVVQRLHYAWKYFLALAQYSDFEWLPPWRNGNEEHGILTHNQPFYLYTTRSCGPNEYVCSQFDFHISNEDYPVMLNDDIKSNSEQLLEQYLKTGSLTEHNVILVPLGCDFCYKNIKDWELVYGNYMKISEFINKNPDYNTEIQFGTVKTYFDEIHKRGAVVPTLKGDFFVYADLFETGLPGYWSGYYTTRPATKILGRNLEAKLRSAEILFTMALNKFNNLNYVHTQMFKNEFIKLVHARQTLAHFQHHDAITGTSKSFVMKDLTMKLLDAIYDSIAIQKHSVHSILFPNNSSAEIIEEYLWNDLEKSHTDTVFRISRENPKKIIFFNPLAQRRVQFIKLATNNINTKVKNHVSDEEISVQISPIWEYDKQGTNVFIAPEKFELSFLVELSPMSLTTYELYYNSFSLDMPMIYSNVNISQSEPEFDLKFLRKADLQLENRKYLLRFNGTSGLLKLIYSKKYKRSTKCVMEFAAYNSIQFLSGAYIFQPELNSPQIEKPILNDYGPIIHVVIGKIYSQLSVIYGEFLTNSIRLYNTNSYLADAIHIENSLNFGGPASNLDKEVFMRFRTDIKNYNPPIIYTDSNGFLIQKRTFVKDAGIPGNYFPITTMAYIEDRTVRLSLLTNHAQGAASLEKGYLEVMLDRRIISDDDKGLGEGVLDNTKIVNDFWLLPEYFDKVHQRRMLIIKRKEEIPNPSMFANHMSNSLNYPVNIFSLSENDDDAPEIIPITKLIRECFPCDVHLVNLRVQEKWNFVHTYSKNAFMILHRQGYTCNLKTTYKCIYSDFKEECGFDVIKLEKLVHVSLTGLIRRGNLSNHFNDIHISPMQIKTYNVTFS